MSLFFQEPSRVAALRFVRALIDKKLAIEDDRAIFPGGARAVLLTGKAICRALGIADVRHRRGKEATTHVLLRRLLALDYLIERPTLGWLPTKAEKVQRFEALGIDRGTLPYRKYGKADMAQPRYFALKLPIAVDEQAATFMYVDPGQSTDSELRAWGAAHARYGRRSEPGLSPCTSSLSVWARRRRTGRRRCSNTGPRTATGRARTSRPGRPRPSRKSVKNSPGLKRR